MPKRDIIVIGASAGGVRALIDLVKTFPKDLHASVFVVVHLSPTSPSQLPEIINWFSGLKAVHPKDGEAIQPGTIYVAPPDYHLLVDNGFVVVKKGPKENRFRPSIDALFRSAAYVYGPRVIGLVLTGMLNDGTSGLWSVKRLGGTTIIQDPVDAEYPHMPQNVLEYVDVDYSSPLSEIGMIVTHLTAEEAAVNINITAGEMQQIKKEVIIAAHEDAFELGIMNMGELTPFTCPQCHGALISLKDGKTVRYRCHTGHAFTASALLAGITESVEETLWASVRALEETNMLLVNIASQYEAAGNADEAAKFTRKAVEIARRARVIKKSIFLDGLLSEDIVAGEEDGKKIEMEAVKASV